MAEKPTFRAQVVKAVVAIAVGTSTITALCHAVETPGKPYYAIIAAQNVAATHNKKQIEGRDGFILVRSDAK